MITLKLSLFGFEMKLCELIVLIRYLDDELNDVYNYSKFEMIA